MTMIEGTDTQMTTKEPFALWSSNLVDWFTNMSEKIGIILQECTYSVNKPQPLNLINHDKFSSKFHI